MSKIGNMAAQDKHDLGRLKKNELIELILNSKPLTSEVNQSDSAFTNGNQTTVSANVPTETSDNDYMDNVSCSKVSTEHHYLKQEILVLKKLVEHLEKRIIDQEEIIRLLRNDERNNNVKSNFSRQNSNHSEIKQAVPIVPSTNCWTKRNAFNWQSSSPPLNTKLNEKDQVRNPTKTEITNKDVSEAIDLAQKTASITNNPHTSNVIINSSKTNRTITGTRSNNKINTVPRKGYIYAFRLHPETTEENLVDFLKETAPDIDFCCGKIVKKDKSMAAFKVSYSLKHEGKVFDPVIWPDGVGVSRYTFPKKTNFRKPRQAPRMP